MIVVEGLLIKIIGILKVIIWIRWNVVVFVFERYFVCVLGMYWGYSRILLGRVF